jgi:hypothetical protein
MNWDLCVRARLNTKNTEKLKTCLLIVIVTVVVGGKKERVIEVKEGWTRRQTDG